MISAERAYAMLGNETLWDTAVRCHELLSKAGIAYSVCGGVAVCLHGYQRNTTDLDLIARRSDTDAIRELFTEAGFHWDDKNCESRTAGALSEGIAVQFVVAGDRAGRGIETLADPEGEANVEERDGLIVIRLSRLIEMKLACGMSNLRRTHKDFADVVELIAIRKLDGSFAGHLHPSVRAAYRQLVRHAAADET